MELVSVIVPVYNIENFLPRCLACLEMQTYPDLEIILVDDGSTDNSGHICDAFAAKHSFARVIHHSENKGTWATRNDGQDAANGRYLWFPDGDDYFHKDIVKVMHDIINQTSSAGDKYDLVIVNYRETSSPDEDIDTDIVPSYREITAAELLDNMDKADTAHISNTMWNKFFRRDLISGLRTRNFKYAQDRDFSIRVYIKEPAVAFVENELYHWLQHPKSAVHAPDFPFIHGQCATSIYYNNLMDLEGDSIKFSPYLLYSLYYWMSSWVNCTQGTDYEGLARREVKKIVTKTGRAYFNCKSIKTTRKRLSLLLKLRFSKAYMYYLRFVQPKTVRDERDN